MLGDDGVVGIVLKGIQSEFGVGDGSGIEIVPLDKGGEGFDEEGVGIDDEKARALGGHGIRFRSSGMLA